MITVYSLGRMRPKKTGTLADLKVLLRKFRDERDWEQFHDPKNLAEAISIEAGELLEKFLWKTVEDSRALSDEDMLEVRDEAADIFLFTLYFCEATGIDILREAFRKIQVNNRKYPADKARGTARKYTKLKED